MKSVTNEIDAQILWKISAFYCARSEAGGASPVLIELEKKMKFLKLTPIAALMIAAACSQSEPESNVIYAEPVYDKWGNEIIRNEGGGCTDSGNCPPPPPPPPNDRYPDPQGTGGGGSSSSGGGGGSSSGGGGSSSGGGGSSSSGGAAGGSSSGGSAGGNP